MRNLLARLRAAAEDRLWPCAVFFGALATAATFGNEPGRYIGDNRYDQFAAPGRRLAHSLALWDGSRGLGRVREDLWPGLNLPLALLRSLGLSVWATERCFHALLLAVGALGVVAVLRFFRPRIGPGHVLAGLVYSFGPYAAAFLQPSNLYAACALAPWMALCGLRGLTGDRPWRWAAAFALLVFALGNADPPGVVFAASVLVPVTAWVVLIDRSVRPRAALGWLLRTGALTLGVSLAALFKTWVAASTFVNRLDTTESPAIVNSSSSWTETLRGLGFWLTYFRGAGLARPQTEVLFANPVVILATLAVPVAAIASLAAARLRARVLFAMCALYAAAVMVGTYPLDRPSPYGRMLTSAYDAVPKLAAFRTSYKVGAVLVLGLAGLVGLGLGDLRGWLTRTRRARLPATIAAFGVVAITAVPFWHGTLYDASKGYDAVPDYWPEALSYVDDLPGTGRVLLLPGTTRTQYRWGWVGDDIVDAMLRRDHAIDTAIPLSEPQAANLLHAVSESVAEGTYQAGTIAPILRRLGIDRILIRNDVDWAVTRTIRPARLDALRQDADLRLLRTFGRAGEHTTASTDHTDDGDRERRLPPVEVYELARPGPAGPRAVVAAAGSVLVSGDGEAWPLLARNGDLDDTGPVVYSGSVADDALPGVLDRTDRVVVSDSNRRRVVTVNSFDLDAGPTLAAGQDQDRPAADLFRRPGSQTVAWFDDATRISATGASRGLRGSQPALRPAAAFDRNAGSAWTTFEATNQEGIRLRVDFRRPTVVRAAELTTNGTGNGSARITSARLLFSDGSQVGVPFAGRSVSLRFTARTTRWVEIEIAQVSSGRPAQVGFSEVAFPGSDLQEWIALPDDLARRADADAAVARRLAALPLTFQFDRAHVVGQLPSEPALRRRFRVPSPRSFTLRGTIRTAAADTVSVARALADGCNDKTVEVDGRPVVVRLAGEASALRPGAPIPIEGCDPVELAAGWHRLEVANSPVTELWLHSSARPIPASRTRPPTVRVLAASPGHFTLRVDAPDGGRLVSSQSWERRWVATVDGRPLGAATSLDTLSGWTLPRGRGLVVRLDYRPQQRFQVVLAASGLAVAVCLALVLWPRRGQVTADQASPTSSS